MLLLVLFAFVAGAATALSPCVLPVLPVALAAGATGGRRRPLGVVTGLVLSFTFATVALVYLLSALGLPDKLFRTLAIVVLGVAGVVLIVPGAGRSGRGLADPADAAPAGPREAATASARGSCSASASASSTPPARGRSWQASSPCPRRRTSPPAGWPSRSRTARVSAVVLYALMLGGRRLSAPLARRGAVFQQAMGVVMLVVAVVMATELDIRFENRIAASLPAILVNPSKDSGGERAPRATGSADVRGGMRTGPLPRRRTASGGGGGRLQVIGRAPEMRGDPALVQHPAGARSRCGRCAVGSS